MQARHHYTTNHGHTAQAADETAGTRDPANALPAVAAVATYQNFVSTVAFKNPATTNTGGGQSHANLQPYLCIHFIIALVGIYPSRH